MSRRRRAFINRHEDGLRMSIGDTHVSTACSRLDILCKQACAMHVPQRFSVTDVIPMIFDDEIVRKLKEIRRYIDTSSNTGRYLHPTYKAHINLNFQGHTLPCPQPEAMHYYPDRIAPLTEAIGAIQDLREEYGAVKHMLRWFNRNATPGAVRTYWPAVLTLCPQSPMCAEYADPPTRYIAPPGIGEMLSLVRDTAATAAAIQLMPSDLIMHERRTAWLTFSEGTVTRNGVDINLDALTVNL